MILKQVQDMILGDKKRLFMNLSTICVIQKTACLTFVHELQKKSIS